MDPAISNITKMKWEVQTRYILPVSTIVSADIRSEQWTGMGGNVWDKHHRMKSCTSYPWMD